MTTSFALPDFRDRFYDMTDDADVRFIGMTLSGSHDLNIARFRFGANGTFLPNAPGFDLTLAVANPGGATTLWTDGTDVFIGDSAVVGTAGVTGSGTTHQVAYWSSSGAIAGDTGMTYDPVTDILSIVASVRLGAGTVTAPSFSFTADTNTGIYSVSGDQLGITTGGTLRVTVTTAGVISTLPILAAAGSAGAPSLSFSGDTDTGLYDAAANSLGLTAGGTLRLTVSTTAVTSTVPYMAPDGTVTAPGVTFASDPNTGLYSVGADQLGVTAGGVLRLTVTTTGLVPTVPVLSIDGAAATPGLSFASDPNTGLYSIGADQLGVSTGGTLRLTVSTTAVTSTVPLLTGAGSAAAPSHAFSSDSNTGLYSIGADQLGITAGGVLSLGVSTTAITAALAVLLVDGAAATPGAAFASDPNTGLYSVGADQLGVATNGILRLTVSTTALTSTLIGIFPASTTAAASIRLPHGAAPTSPVDGDMWTTSAGGLFVRINGVTVGPLS